MDTWTGASGWIVAFMLAGLSMVSWLWYQTRLAQLRKQLSDTERELWDAQRRATYWEAAAGDVRRGIAPPVPSVARPHPPKLEAYR